MVQKFERNNIVNYTYTDEQICRKMLDHSTVEWHLWQNWLRRLVRNSVPRQVWPHWLARVNRTNKRIFPLWDFDIWYRCRICAPVERSTVIQATVYVMMRHTQPVQVTSDNVSCASGSTWILSQVTKNAIYEHCKTMIMKCECTRKPSFCGL